MTQLEPFGKSSVKYAPLTIFIAPAITLSIMAGIAETDVLIINIILSLYLSTMFWIGLSLYIRVIHHNCDDTLPTTKQILVLTPFYLLTFPILISFYLKFRARDRILVIKRVMDS